MQWTIAAAQIEVTHDIYVNMEHMLSGIKEAHAQNAHVVCFPEACLINEEKDARSISKELTILKKAAIEYSIHIIFGSYVLNEKKEVRNQILVISSQGTVLNRYSKRNLYSAESSIVKAGRKNKIFLLDGIPCAVINCWDYAFPEEIRNLAAKGAHVIFCPSYLMSFPRTKEVLEKVPQVRAFDAMSFFVMVDAYAHDTFGKSKICHPLQCLAEIQGKAGMIVATIETDDIHELRTTFTNLKKKLEPSEPMTSIASPHSS